MKPFNICLIKPVGYIHSDAFIELAELIMFSLRELGVEANIGFNAINPDSRNILIGCHLLDVSIISQLPKSTIILNTEQLQGTPWNANIFKWLKSFDVWDYSLKNIENMAANGVPSAKHLNIGFQKELRRIEKKPERDIDVLFYGSTNERRQKVLDDLVSSGLTVKSLFGVYARERDDYIARSKIVLNHHFYKPEIFEVVRVSYLLSNSVAVVGEVNETTSIDDVYRSAITAARYDDLVDACLKLAHDGARLKEAEDRGFAVLAQYPQSVYTSALIG